MYRKLSHFKNRPSIIFQCAGGASYVRAIGHLPRQVRFWGKVRRVGLLCWSSPFGKGSPTFRWGTSRGSSSEDLITIYYHQPVPCMISSEYIIHMSPPFSIDYCPTRTLYRWNFSCLRYQLFFQVTDIRHQRGCRICVARMQLPSQAIQASRQVWNPWTFQLLPLDIIAVTNMI